MSQVTSDSIDGVYPSSNGDGRSNSRALVVREQESQALSPYMMPGGMAPYAAEPAVGGLDFVQLLHAVRRRWLLALCVGLMIGAPLAALVWLITPANYEVIAWLRVGDDPSTLIEQRGYRHRDPNEYEQYRKTQSALIKSPDVLRAALSDPAVASLPMIMNVRDQEEFLKEEISVAFPLESEVLQIKMRGKDRPQLVKIVNGVMEAYLKVIVNSERETTMRRYDTFDRNVKATNAEIADLQDRMQRLIPLEADRNSEQVKAKQQMLMQQANAKLQRLMEAQTKLHLLSNKIAVAQDLESEDQGPPEHLIEAALARDPGIARMSEKIGMYQEAIDSQRQAVKFPDRDPLVQRMEREVSALRDQLEQKKAELRPVIAKYVQTELLQQGRRFDDIPTTLEELIPTQKRQEELVQTLQADYDKLSTEAENVSRYSASVEVLFEEIKRKREMVADLEAKTGQLRLLLDMPNRVTKYMDATEPESANPMLRYFLTAFVAIVGFAVGAGGVVMMEYQARRVNNTADLSIKAGLRVLGTVPNLSRLASSKNLAGSAALQGILAESVDSIRTMLLTREDPPHAVIITSAGDSEGKTTVATHLAASLARSGRRTLLVDGDIRSPSIHAMFNAAPEPGVCEVIRGEADLEGVLQPTPVDGLMLVTAGQCDYQCIAALSKENFKDFIEKAREQFEYVIIDAAPVLTYADMLLMGAHVDAAVLSVRRDVSQMNRVYEARERMESVGIRVLGAVVNGLSETSRRPAYALPSA